MPRGITPQPQLEDQEFDPRVGYILIHLEPVLEKEGEIRVCSNLKNESFVRLLRDVLKTTEAGGWS